MHITVEVLFLSDVNYCLLMCVISGYDGRCGMAAISMTDHGISMTGDGISMTGPDIFMPDQTAITDSMLQELYDTVERHLPVYAQPVFVRIQHQVQLTATFKQIKGSLVKDGFDPELSGQDQLYWLNRSEKQYAKLTKDTHDMIIAGKIRI